MEDWYKMEKEDVLRQLGVDEAQGLSSGEAEKRIGEYGYNEFDKQKSESIVKKILHQLGDVSTIILLIAAGLSLLLAIREGHGFIEPAVIAGIVVMNLVLGITQERSAEKSLEALSNLHSPHCLVLRDGGQREIGTRDVVPGDILLLKPGDMVAADGRLLKSTDLTVDESSLTGESEPSQKSAEARPEEEAPLGDRLNMVFSGCLVAAGRGAAVVTATGMKSEMGKIAGYLNNDQKLKTPLQQRLDNIGKIISIVAIASAVLLFGIGMLQGEEFWSMVLLAVSLAVAAVPETLSLIVTLTLAQGVRNMVGKNALIRKLPAVETLGSTSVICSDKTGTLTQNRMSIRRLWAGEGEPFGEDTAFSSDELVFLGRMLLASNATVETDGDGGLRIVGDPTESAIVRLAKEKGIDRDALEREYPRVAEIPFSSDRKMMTTIHRDPTGGWLVLSKGAFDRLPCERADAETSVRRRDVHDSFASGALRVIALASRHINELPPERGLEQVERELRFEGIVGLIDPPRPEAAQAIRLAKKAGIRTVMITGDHAATAGAIARELGILSEGEKVVTGRQLAAIDDDDLCEDIRQYSVYARVSPEDKIRIVEAWQENDEVVAMTGDGVNDAPALKAADVGVAMGIAGTEVAKSASDMVLTDDNFATIVDAVHEGRNVFANLRKTVYFLLVCNLSEIIIILGAQMIGWGTPVTPVLLLLINVIGDGIPGLHLAREKSDPKLMDRRPIGRDESFFGGGMMQVIIQQTLAFTLVTWVGYYLGAFVNLSDRIVSYHSVGQSVAFLILGWTSILHIFTVRSRTSVFRRALWDNPPLVISALAMLALFAALVAIPALGGIFGLVGIGARHWLIATGLSLIPTIVAEIGKWGDEIGRQRQYRRRIVRHRSRS